MKFLDELDNKTQNSSSKNESDKTPRDLWESCFKYFKHFTSIIQKDTSSFAAEFNFNTLNLKHEVIICGPFEISRSHKNDTLELKLKFITQLQNDVIINRKDERSAELLKINLSKEGIFSETKNNSEGKYSIELKPRIISTFKLILKNNENFFLKYHNINSSLKRTLALNTDQINESTMDSIAQYIIGQNPDYYTESINDSELEEIRSKILQEKQKIIEKEAQIKAEKQEQERLKEIEKRNSLKQRSKRFIITKSIKLKDDILKFLDLK